MSWLRTHWSTVLVAGVGLAVLLAAAATLVAVTSNRERATTAVNDADAAAVAANVVCKQVLKLRNANLKGIDVFEATVVAGYKEKPPTAQERAVADEFFAGQRAVFDAVRCP